MTYADALHTFTEANVETAMCLWEAYVSGDGLDDETKATLEAYREEHGTVILRHHIIALVEACEAQWEADRVAGTEQVPYDWEHCPAFLNSQRAHFSL